VIDDIASVDPWRVRCLEVRGHGEAIDPLGDAPVIRIHPERVISFGIGDLDSEPHDLVASKRDVARPAQQ
jgi:pyridoxamine 5'-phosphate oxidase family protein